MRKTGILITFFLLFTILHGFSLNRDLQINLYKQANELFQKASDTAVSDPVNSKILYKESLQQFLQLSNGVNNGKLFYNIGNIYFQLGDIGKAILYYRKASLLIPGDLNLKENLNTAREKRIDKISEQESSRILETIFYLHYNLSSSFKSILFAISIAIVWISASLILLKKKSPPSWHHNFLTSITIFSIISLIFLGSLLIDTIELHNHPGGVITTNEVIARKGDGEAYSPSFKAPLHSGLEFSLIRERQGWYYIKLPDKTKTWIPEESAELVTAN